MTVRPPRLGVVSAFDAHSGRGTVQADGGEELSFHCTAVADGSRAIEPGTRVVYLVSPGAPGRWEAAAMVKIS